MKNYLHQQAAMYSNTELNIACAVSFTGLAASAIAMQSPFLAFLTVLIGISMAVWRYYERKFLKEGLNEL